MVKIRYMTLVKAPVERCFRLALSIDLHCAATDDVALSGRTSGLLGPGDTVGWQRSHLGWRLQQESRVEVWRPFSYYREVMVEGTSGFYEHEHHFAPMNDGTRIRDEIRFTAPMGMLGRLAERVFLRRRMIAVLARRNALLKSVAESDDWHQYLDGQPELNTQVYQAGVPAFAADGRVIVE
jgi:ligand-binding SRPBCC domain-containing protein